MRHGRGGRKLERVAPPSPLGESAAVGGDASRPLRGAGRSSQDLVDLSPRRCTLGTGKGTSMAALVPLGVARSRPRRRCGISLQEGHPLNSGECPKSPVNQDAMNQKKKKTCRKRKRSVNTDTPPAEPIPELPDVIVLDILVRLPVKSLLRCKSVCKGWRDIITDPFFVRAHLQRSASRCEQDPCLLITPYTVAGCLVVSNHIHLYQWQQGASMATLMHDKDFGTDLRSTRYFAHCDGLVLITSDMRLFLFNPATREAIKLPDRDRGLHRSSLFARCCCAGLGLDPLTGKHKVVRAFCRLIGPDTDLRTDMRMEVFTISGNNNGGGSAWREIKDDLPYPAENFSTGKAVNGFMFWRLASNCRHLQQRPWGLLRLSLADETFSITRLPDSLGPVPPGTFELDVLHGELCVSARLCMDTVTMWILQIQDGGQGQTWEQRYTVHLTCLYRPMAFLPGGQMMLYTDYKVCLYNMATAKLTTVCQLNRMKYQGRRARTWKNIFSFNVNLYTESLVRISV